jgi:EmrB/QacA subfamily drug resistance transporter
MSGLRARKDASPQLVLVIVCAGVVLASLDLFIVNVALPQMAGDFHLGADSLPDLSWVLNAYAIVYASLLVLFGRLADRYRRDRGFLLGVAVFVVASAACAAATSLPMLVAFRIVQAAGAALLTPTSLGLILATTTPERRHGAVRTWAAVGGFAAALGPVIGGLLVAASWRWVFLVNVPIGLLALAVGWRRLPAVAGQPIAAPDAVGAVLITGGIGALTLGLVKGGAWGWGSDTTIAVLALSVLALGLFAIHTARSRNPLIDRELFRLRPFTGASSVALLFSAAFGAMLLSRVVWAQDVWHWSALLTGLSIAPGPIMVPFCSFLLAGPLIARFGPGPVIAAGSTIFAAGVVWWAFAAGLQPDYVGEMLGGIVLTGIGVGLTLPTMMSTGAGSLPPSAFATGSAVVNMFRQIGLAVGVAVLIAVLGSPHSPAATLVAYQRAWVVTAAIAFAGGVIGLALLTARRPPVAVAAAATTRSPA